MTEQHPTRTRRGSASLTTRLTLSVIALVVMVSVLIGAATTFAVNASLTARLDDDVRATLARAQNAPVFPARAGRATPPGRLRSSGNGEQLDDRRGQGVGTLTAYWLGSGATPLGDVITDGSRGSAERQTLPEAAFTVLDNLPTDGQPRTVHLDGVGDYRVAVTGDADTKVAAGLPLDDVRAVVDRLVAWEAALILLGALIAAGLGQVVVRRQLRPLREVAATAHAVTGLPLASGAIDLAERVPERLTDERTEVGQVGAALNALLAHVELSLEARHRSEQQVRQFVADASHELRSPLATIAGYTELARRRPDDEATLRTALTKVEEESGRMTSLVEDLLLLARLDAGRPLEQQPVDLSRLLVEAVSDAHVLAPDHHWRIDVPEEALEVTGDEQRLHQLVTNLLNNARQHTPAGTTILVRASVGGFTVEDDGPGFAPGSAEGAFERFVRGDASRTRSADSGVGLGLALVRAIARAHGGTVTLTSEPGHTRFEVLLPDRNPA